MLWGRIASKKNYLTVILILGLIKSIEPLMWLLAGKNTYILYPIYIMFGAYEGSGIVGAGLWVTCLNYLLSISDSKNKTLLLNYSIMFKGVAFIIASITGGYLAKSLQESRTSIPFLVNSLESVILLSFLFGFISAIYLLFSYRKLNTGEQPDI